MRGEEANGRGDAGTELRSGAMAWDALNRCDQISIGFPASTGGSRELYVVRVCLRNDYALMANGVRGQFTRVSRGRVTGANNQPELLSHDVGSNMIISALRTEATN